jgi:hypothetical protein
MFSRVTLLEIDTMRTGVEDATALFREEVLPGLREEDGYQGALVLATPEGRGLILTLWETEEGARDASGFATEALERNMTMFTAPPGREQYMVVVADMPSLSLA